MSEESTKTRDEAKFREDAASALQTLARVGLGDHAARIEINRGGALGALFAGINDLLTNLSAEQEQAASFRESLEEKLAVVEEQRAAIREASTPVIEVWQGVLCVPVVGVMDAARSDDIAETLLRAVSEREARCAIIDLTGIGVMDSDTVDHLMRLAQAIRLLGAECVVAGLSAEIAQTTAQMGLDLTGIVVHRNLCNALAQYVDH